MTVSSTYAPVKQIGNGSTVDFSYSFPIGVASYLEVYLELISTGVQTLQTQGSDYTLVFDETGGTVTFTTAPSNLYNVIIIRNVAFEQQVSLTTSKVFDPKVIEGALDKLTEQTQQLKEFDSRVPVLPIGSTVTNVTLPAPSAGKALLWNATADAIENSTDDFNDIVTDAEAAQTAAETAQGLAEAAKVGAEAAQGLSEAARDASVIAQGLSESARDDALIAQGDAEAARDLAEDWASKTDGEVDATDYSSKAYAIGGTGVTGADGAAKEWAIETSDTVDGSNYSSKEWATGTQTRGDASGGSAKDWATYTAGTVDDTEYSAKYYAAAADVAKIEWQGTWSAGSYNESDAVYKDGTSYIATTTTSEEPSGAATDWDILALKGTDGTGSGDVSSDTSTSVDSEIALYDGTTGKKIKRATLTGLVKATSGVPSAATAGTDYSAGTASLDTGILKSTTSTGALTIATASDIPTPMTTRGDILYHDGSSWARLAKGTSGQVLTQGADDPAWATPSGGGGTIYGTCSTSGSTAAKTVSYSGFTLETGATINVLFSNANTATSPTLNVNSTGAKSIATETGTVTSSTYPAYFPASSIITFVYDGTYWRFKNNIVKNYVSGTSWYRIWADGFKEQGGRADVPPNASETISLAIAFSNTNYNLAISKNINAYNSELASRSTSSMVIYNFNNNSGFQLDWRAAGY